MIIDPENLSKPRDGEVQIFRRRDMLANAVCHIKRSPSYARNAPKMITHYEIDGYLEVKSQNDVKALYELPDVVLIMEFQNGDKMPFQITGKDIFKGRFGVTYVARMPED